MVLSVQTAHGLAKFRILGVWPDGGELLGEIFSDGGGFGAGLGATVRVGKGDGLVWRGTSAGSGYGSDYGPETTEVVSIGGGGHGISPLRSGIVVGYVSYFAVEGRDGWVRWILDSSGVSLGGQCYNFWGQ